MSTIENTEVELLNDSDHLGVVVDYDIVEPPLEIKAAADAPISLEVFRHERHRRELVGMPHEQLVEQAKAGDSLAFEMLVKDTTDDAFGLAFRLTGSTEDAQDIVQDAYVRVFKGLEKFRGDAQFSTWLYRIVANCAHTHMGRRRRHKHEILPEEDDRMFADTDSENSPETQAEKTLLREKVDRALQKLPGKLREVVVLRDVYDLPHKDIAEQLSITETTAKVRLHRARKQLRELVFPHIEEPEEPL
jgi:RNA polymerase sigma-70 factor, ECF subfamily